MPLTCLDLLSNKATDLYTFLWQLLVGPLFQFDVHGSVEYPEHTNKGGHDTVNTPQTTSISLVTHIAKLTIIIFTLDGYPLRGNNQCV